MGIYAKATRILVVKALHASRGNISEAARTLGISLRGLRYRLRRWDKEKLWYPRSPGYSARLGVTMIREMRAGTRE